MIQPGQVYIDDKDIMYKIVSIGSTWDGTTKLLIDILNTTKEMKHQDNRNTTVSEDVMLKLIKDGTIWITEAGTILFGDGK